MSNGLKLILLQKVSIICCKDYISIEIHLNRWSKEEWREGFSTQNPSEAREHMNQLLSKLKKQISGELLSLQSLSCSSIAELKAEDLLPDSIFEKRLTVVDLDKEVV